MLAVNAAIEPYLDAQKLLNGDVPTLGCIVQNMDAAVLRELLLNLSPNVTPNVTVSVGPHDSPLAISIDSMFGAALGFVETNWNLVISEAIRGAMGGPLMTLANFYMEAVLNEEKGKDLQCNVTHGAPKDQGTEASPPIWGAVAVFAFGLAGSAAFIDRRKKSQSLRLLQKHEEGRQQGSASSALIDDSLFSNAAASTWFCYDCICARVSWWSAISVAVLLLGNMALYAKVNMSVNYETFVQLTLQTQPTPLQVDSNDLSQYLHELWGFNQPVIAIMIGVWSGLWPFAMAVLMGAVFFCPFSIVSPGNAEFILAVLNMFGKGTFVYFLAQVVVIAGGRFNKSIGEPGTDSYVAIDILVTPEFGFYGSCIAPIFSLALSTLLLALCRSIVPCPPRHESDQKFAMRSFPAVTPWGQSYFWYLWDNSLMSRLAIPTGLVSCLALTIFGVIYKGYEFHFTLSVQNKPVLRSVVTRSIWNMGSSIADFTTNPTDVYLHCTQWVFLSIVVFIPAVLHLALGFLWFVPLKTASQRRLLYFCEAASAWSTPEVLVLTTIAIPMDTRECMQYSGTACIALVDVVTPLQAGFCTYIGVAAVYVVLTQVLIRHGFAVLEHRTMSKAVIPYRSIPDLSGITDSKANAV